MQFWTSMSIGTLAGDEDKAWQLQSTHSRERRRLCPSWIREPYIWGTALLLLWSTCSHKRKLPCYSLLTVFSSVQFVDDVEFWFPPGKKSIVQYRSASRSGFIDFNANKKRVKASTHTHHFCHLFCCIFKVWCAIFVLWQELRLALEKKGWASESTFWIWISIAVNWSIGIAVYHCSS